MTSLQIDGAEPLLRDAPAATRSRTAGDVAVWVALAALQALLSPLLLLCWIERRRSTSDRALMATGELLSLVPGPIGNLVRKAFYGASIHACARRAYIAFGTLIVNRRAAIGERAFIGPYCVLGAVRVGAGTRLASRVSAMSGRHQHGSSRQGVEPDGFRNLDVIAIGDGAWVGEGAIVMANVGRKAIVGAGSVVVRDVPDGVTVVGNPARPLGTRAEPVDRQARK